VGRYDVIIAGAHVGGLAAAALLAKKGRKVLVLSDASSQDAAPGVIRQEGFVFSAGPALLFGFEQNGAYSRLFDQIGISKPDIDRNRATYQVVLPDKRVTLSRDRNRTFAEFEREFPTDIAKIKKMYQDLERVSIRRLKSKLSAMLAQRRAGSFLAGYGFSPSFMVFIDIQARYFFGTTASGLSVSQLVDLCIGRPVCLPRRWGSLSRALQEKMIQAGGELRFQPATGLARRKRKVIGISSTDGQIEGKSVVINKPGHSHPTLCLGIREQVVPISMCDYVLCLPDYARPLDFFSVTLNDTKETADAAPAGMRALTMECFGSETGNLDREQRIDRCAELMPFLRDFIAVVSESTRKEALRLPDDIPCKLVAPKAYSSLLHRGSPRNVFVLNEPITAPLLQMPAVRKIVSILG
jgi:glycine/D-amino acid oxidase-like deaminating enzyme